MKKPSKHFRLVIWRLLYHVAVEKTLDRQDEIDACRHARLALACWDEEKRGCPRELAKLVAKRQRRLEWFLAHGSVPDGWTPPDPADPRRTGNKPIAAYLARRKTTVAELFAKTRRIRKNPNWTAMQRVEAWIGK